MTRLVLALALLCPLAAHAQSSEANNQAIAIAGGGSSGGTSTLRYAPAVVGPTIYPGQCQTPVAAGVSVIGFGGTVGSAIPDAQCNRRQNAAALLALHHEGAAVELMCGETDVRAAMLRAGTPCAADRPMRVAEVVAVRTRPAFCSARGAEDMEACR